MEFSLPCTGRSKCVCSLHLTQWAKPEGTRELPPGSQQDDLIASLGLEVKDLPFWSIVQIPDTSVPWKCPVWWERMRRQNSWQCYCSAWYLCTVSNPVSGFPSCLWPPPVMGSVHHRAFLLSPGCPDHEWPLPYFPGGTADDPHGDLCAHLSECMVPSLGRHYGKLG